MNPTQDSENIPPPHQNTSNDGPVVVPLKAYKLLVGSPKKMRLSPYTVHKERKVDTNSQLRRVGFL